jgi:hypothetical protein
MISLASVGFGGDNDESLRRILRLMIGDYRRCQTEIPLIVLFRLSESALNLVALTCTLSMAEPAPDLNQDALIIHHRETNSVEAVYPDSWDHF